MALVLVVIASYPAQCEIAILISPKGPRSDGLTAMRLGEDDLYCVFTNETREPVRIVTSSTSTGRYCYKLTFRFNDGSRFPVYGRLPAGVETGGTAPCIITIKPGETVVTLLELSKDHWELDKLPKGDCQLTVEYEVKNQKQLTSVRTTSNSASLALR